MYSFDRMIVQAEMDHRGRQALRGGRTRRRNRFVELHREPIVLSAADAERTR